MGKVAERFRAKRTAATSAPTPLMTEGEFMRRRRMFCCPLGADVRIASQDELYGHRHWMRDLDDFAFNRAVRGYYLDGDLVFYRAGFEPVGLRSIREALPELQAGLDLPPETVIWAGAQDIGTGALQGRQKVGILGEITPSPAVRTIEGRR